MSKPRNRPSQEIPVDSQTLAAAADPGLFRFSFLGSSRHVLNWRIGEVRRLKDGEARSFLLSHPDLVLENPLAPPPPRNYVMPRFRIGSDNLVVVMAPGEEAPEDHAVFSSSLELLRASRGWRPTRLVRIWNGIAGVEPVRHFESKLVAIHRIWNGIQPLVAPARKSRRQPAAQKTVTPEPPVEAAAVEAVSKKERVLALLRSASGATLNEIMAATGWQKHSVRGFLSGAVRKKMGLTVISFTNPAGERIYRLKR